MALVGAGVGYGCDHCDHGGLATFSKDQPIWKVEDSPPTFAEDAFYAQSKLLHDALEQVQYGELAKSHWYFLGVAGDSYQDVFKSEVVRIKEQFDTRFGTVGRSMMLVNNPDTNRNPDCI